MVKLKVKLVDVFGLRILVFNVCVIILFVGNKLVVIGKLFGKCVEMFVVFCWLGVGVWKLVLYEECSVILLVSW